MQIVHRIAEYLYLQYLRHERFCWVDKVPDEDSIYVVQHDTSMLKQASSNEIIATYQQRVVSEQADLLTLIIPMINSKRHKKLDNCRSHLYINWFLKGITTSELQMIQSKIIIKAPIITLKIRIWIWSTVSTIKNKTHNSFPLIWHDCDN